MKRKINFGLIVIIAIGMSACFQAQNEKSSWFQWRGPLETGVALESNPPFEFNESLNLKWKTEIQEKVMLPLSSGEIR